MNSLFIAVAGLPGNRQMVYIWIIMVFRVELFAEGRLEDVYRFQVDIQLMQDVVSTVEDIAAEFGCTARVCSGGFEKKER